MAAFVMQYTDSVGSANEPRLGTQVDDPPTLLPDHDAPSSLTSEKGSLQIDGKRQIKVLLTYVLRKIVWCQARIIDENIDASELPYINSPKDLVEVSHIHASLSRSFRCLLGKNVRRNERISEGTIRTEMYYSVPIDSVRGDPG
jgi:hypothetical protein